MHVEPEFDPGNPDPHLIRELEELAAVLASEHWEPYMPPWLSDRRGIYIKIEGDWLSDLSAPEPDEL